MNPPLLKEMTELAQKGITTLEATLDYPKQEIQLRELKWSDEHRCLIGGPEFRVMRVPSSIGHVLVVPRSIEPELSLHSNKNLDESYPRFESYDDIYKEQKFALIWYGPSVLDKIWYNQLRWVARFMCHSTYELPIQKFIYQTLPRR